MANRAVFGPAAVFPGSGRIDPEPTSGVDAAWAAHAASGLPLELLVDSTPALPAQVFDQARRQDKVDDLDPFLQNPPDEKNAERGIVRAPTDVSETLRALRRYYFSQARAKPGQRKIPPPPDRELGMNPLLVVVPWGMNFCSCMLEVQHAICSFSQRLPNQLYRSMTI